MTDGAGPKRMHSGIIAITAINWKIAIVPSSSRRRRLTIENKDHVMINTALKTSWRYRAPEMPVLAENFIPRRNSSITGAIELLSEG